MISIAFLLIHKNSHFVGSTLLNAWQQIHLEYTIVLTSLLYVQQSFGYSKNPHTRKPIFGFSLSLKKFKGYTNYDEIHNFERKLNLRHTIDILVQYHRKATDTVLLNWKGKSFCIISIFMDQRLFLRRLYRAVSFPYGRTSFFRWMLYELTFSALMSFFSWGALRVKVVFFIVQHLFSATSVSSYGFSTCMEGRFSHMQNAFRVCHFPSWSTTLF